MKRASTSLPVPDSPTMSTVQSLPATRRARSASRREPGAHATSSTLRAPSSRVAGAATGALTSGAYAAASAAATVNSSDIRPSHARMHREAWVQEQCRRKTGAELRERSHRAARTRQFSAAGASSTSIFRRDVAAQQLELAQFLDQGRAAQAEQARGVRDYAVGALERLATSFRSISSKCARRSRPCSGSTASALGAAPLPAARSSSASYSTTTSFVASSCVPGGKISPSSRIRSATVVSSAAISLANCGATHCVDQPAGRYFAADRRLQRRGRR